MHHSLYCLLSILSFLVKTRSTWLSYSLPLGSIWLPFARKKKKNITTFCVVSMILVASKLPRRGRQVGPIPSRSVQTAPICAEGRHQRCQVSSFGSFIVLPSAQAEMTSLSSGPESPLKIWLRLTCRGQGYNLTSLTLAWKSKYCPWPQFTQGLLLNYEKWQQLTEMANISSARMFSL